LRSGIYYISNVASG